MKTPLPLLDLPSTKALVDDIQALKAKKGFAVVAHSYVTPDILYGIADLIGDSYQISVKAQDLKQDIILFCGVRFMAETIKLLNPQKRVYMTRQDIGCTLSESITGQDVKDMRAKYPKASFVCYVNTTADVKAECDACCTSANAAKVVNAMPTADVVYLPDKYMAKNLKTDKNVIPWEGRCVVHEDFDLPLLETMREQFPEAYVMAHPECKEEVVAGADFAGSTGQMMEQAKKISQKEIIMLTECGLSDRLRQEMPEKDIVGTCRLCPYMKENLMIEVRDMAQDLSKGFEITVPDDIAPRARKCIEKMVEIVEA